jgi:murein DD-endopeptidase MepM/ murein hydrolase activator NlpD
MRTHPVTGVYKLHTGADFAAATGTRIGAAHAGVVRAAGWQNGNGNTVVIDHGNGVSTLYGHGSKLLVKPGDRVEAGQAVALAGSTGYATGPHLHLEVRKDDKPMDPLPWLRRHGVSV